MPEEINKDYINLYGVKTDSIPKPPLEIGIDQKDSVLWNLIGEGTASQVDLSKIESLFSVSQNRNTIYDMLDTMSEDPLIAAALEIYAEDATEPNDKGQIVWVESPDGDASKYIQFLLNSLDIDKHIYQWVYSLCKYGDLYLRLYKKSEIEEALKDKSDVVDEKQELNENVIIKAFNKNDKFVHYIEMVPNPAEMFELVKFGKTFSYIKAPSSITKTAEQGIYNSYYKYSFKQQDVELYQPFMFTHACLEEGASRTPEQVELFGADGSDSGITYTVRRGQSLLYNSFKIWRELSLLENSMLLNRITKSSIVRLIQVQVGNMPKEAIGPHLTGIKQLIEQKTAIDTGNRLTEYTNPGPIENNVYVPIRGDQGVISTQQIGGDVNVKDIVDIDYFKDKLTGNLRIPKQYLGDTDDSTGFNGGTSLSLVSSRYAKAVKRIQSTVTQCITDVINILLLDKGLKKYINKFTIKMLPPTTQEEIDRRNSMDSRISIINNILMLLDPIEDPSAKLAITKELLSDVINNSEVIDIIQEQIDKLKEQVEEVIPGDEDSNDMGGMFQDASIDGSAQDFGPEPDMGEISQETAEESNAGEETILPSPSQLGQDFTDNTISPE